MTDRRNIATSTRKLTNLLLVTFQVLLFIPQAWLVVSGSKEKKFKTQGLFDLGDLGLNSLDGMIIAIGDSNADQFRDIFTLSSDQRSVNLHLWDHQLYQFVSVPTNPVIPKTIGGFVITNIIVTDINYDGRLDILAMGSTDPSDKEGTLKMEVWYGRDGTTFAPGVSIPSSLPAHPLVFDSQGSMAMDFLGLPSSLPSVFKVWKNMASASTPSNSSTPFSIADPPFNTPINCKLPNPHSNAFIDLDGDCLADIFLVCQDGGGEQSYQIWLNKKDAGFALARTGRLPWGTKQVTFADMDRDGTIDMVLAVCPSPNTCKVNVAYNQQIPLCTTSHLEGRCRDPQSLCTPDADFRFSFDSADAGFTTLNIAQLFPNYRLVTELTAADFQGPSPVAIQTGDYNLDGYPDLLLIVAPMGSSTREIRGVPWLLESFGCTSDRCSQDETRNHRRTFGTLSTGDTALSTIDDAKTAFFLDINEDGSLDIVVQRAPLSKLSSDHPPAARTVSVFKNNFFNDAFFLKAIMLNGACSSRCSGQNGQPDYRPYGVNYAGASYKFTIQDTYGERRATAVGQVPFNSYASPMSPYSFFGLGRTNNYVEKMYVGSTRHQAKHWIDIEGLLPNSQLVVIPYQAYGHSDPSSWKKELYLHPADWIPWVSISIALATFFLAIIVLVLHLNEKVFFFLLSSFSLYLSQLVTDLYFTIYFLFSAKTNVNVDVKLILSTLMLYNHQSLLIPIKVFSLYVLMYD